MHGFISYAHDDYENFAELMVHMRSLERTSRVQWLTDKKIKAGDKWSAHIDRCICQSDIHVLLFSPAFIYSDYIIDKEIPAILKRYRAGSLLLPVVLDRCAWNAFVSVIQACPVDTTGALKPILDWKPRRHGFNAAREQISTALDQFIARRRENWKST